MTRVDEAAKILAWRKASVIPGYDSRQWRRDYNGNAILFDAYGDMNSAYGWEIVNSPVNPSPASVAGRHRPTGSAITHHLRG